MDHKLNYFIKSRKRFVERSFVIRLFAIVSNVRSFVTESSSTTNDVYIYDTTQSVPLVELDLVRVTIMKDEFWGYVTGITKLDDGYGYNIFLLERFKDQPLFSFSQSIQIGPGDIENYKSKETITTSYGRYFLNYILLVNAFGIKINYMNKTFSISKIQNELSALLIDGTITIPEFKVYSRAVFVYGHLSEIAVPTMSLKSLTTSDEVKKLRAELLIKYKDQLDDPIIAKLIQDTLNKKDREYLKDDPAELFHNALGDKAWNVQRSKMVVNVGGIPAFSDEVGKLSYIPDSLANGWDKRNLDVIANEIYKASYSRGVETQLGGNQTNIIIRVFQASKIDAEDCGSTSGIPFDLTLTNIQEFDGMYEAGTNIIISKENYSKYVNKRISIRSPQTCKLSPGARYCVKCFGELYRKRNVQSLELDAIDCTATFTQLSLKNMHGTEIKTSQLDFRQYLVSTF